MRMVIPAALLLLMQGEPPSPVVRLHHVHASVPEPAVAMGEAAERVDGSVRSIVQGHGPGVGKTGQYIVFDRESAASSATKGGCDGAIRAAVSWLASSGVAAAEREWPMAAALPGLPCVTIAFAAERPDDVVERLRRRGLDPVAMRDGEPRYDVRPGLVVEIVEDRDRPDTHWCPMHPDVRAPGPGKCPQCAMGLVPIPPPQVGEYGFDVMMNAAPDRQLRFRFVISEPSTGQPVSEFVEVHERLFHLFIISTDLEHFAHVHPERQPDGSFVLAQALAPGEYMLIADVLPQGGTPQMLQRTIVTPGYDGPLFEARPRVAPTSLEQRAGDLIVRLSSSSLTELRPASLTFDVIDATTGRQAAGLEPYLGAAAHLLIVDEALQLPIHAHPGNDSPVSDSIGFDVRFAKAGTYKMWFQFQRNGQVHTVPFVINVAPL